jgi:hypothetical protein
MEWDHLVRAKEGEQLTLKGFLYPAHDWEGCWILASEPNLKKCCVGSPDKHKGQVILEGDFSRYSADLPLQVKGRVHFASNGAYLLSEAEVIQKEGSPIWSAGALVVCLVLLGLKLKRLLLP